MTFFFPQDHPAFPYLLNLLWDKGFALCFKDRFYAAFFMPGSEASGEYRQKEDLCTHINQDKIKCVLGEQLAEDNLATMTMLLSDAREQPKAGMERHS